VVQEKQNVPSLKHKEAQNKNFLKSNLKKIKKSFVSNYISDVVKDIIKHELVNVINKKHN
jgi:hypothetical protein